MNQIVDNYKLSLMDLTGNSKSLINQLTMLAEHHIEYAAAIVQAVENHLKAVSRPIKLPILYLIDSIVKNVKGVYLDLFTRNIVDTFCGVFKEVEEVTRKAMYVLRQTWTGVFPAETLQCLDVAVRCIDPAWPVIVEYNVQDNPPSAIRLERKPERLLMQRKAILEPERKKAEIELLQKELDDRAKMVTLETPMTPADVFQGAPLAPEAAITDGLLVSTKRKQDEDPRVLQPTKRPTTERLNVGNWNSAPVHLQEKSFSNVPRNIRCLDNKENLPGPDFTGPSPSLATLPPDPYIDELFNNIVNFFEKEKLKKKKGSPAGY